MKTVAVLDDDDSLVELFQTFLSEEGYAVKRVVFSKILPEILENIRVTQPDLLILDVHLPGLGSFEIMQGISADPGLKDIAILVSSASRPSLGILQQLMKNAQLKMPMILEKPFDLDELARAVETLTGSSPAS